MKENGTLPEIKWVEVETGLAQATAATNLAQKGISDCKLYATKDGIIGKKNIESGMNVVPFTSAIELINIEDVNIKIPVPENEIPLFKKGQNAQVTTPALSQKNTGIVNEVGVSADILSHTYPVKIAVKNIDLAIKPGMICQVSIALSNQSKGLLISNKAVQLDITGNQFVYIINNNKAEKRTIKTAGVINNQILVTDGLKENDEVIVDGQQKLAHGMLVNVTK